MEKVGNLSEQMEEASKSMASESKSMENQSGLVESPSNQKPSESKPMENLADSNKAQADKQKEKRETQNVEADQQSYKEEFHQRNGKDQIDMDHGTILTEARSNELSRPSTPVPSSAESVPKNPVKWQYTLANLIYLLIFSLPFSLLVFVWCITTIWIVLLVACVPCLGTPVLYPILVSYRILAKATLITHARLNGTYHAQHRPHYGPQDTLYPALYMPEDLCCPCGQTALYQRETWRAWAYFVAVRPWVDLVVVPVVWVVVVVGSVVAGILCSGRVGRAVWDVVVAGCGVNAALAESFLVSVNTGRARRVPPEQALDL